MYGWQAIGSGFVGALALTAVHQTARRTTRKAPRMDLLASRAISGMMASTGKKPPPDDRLQNLALAGDVMANTFYYSLVGTGKPKHAPQRGAILGAAAGVAAVLLPGPLGLGAGPTNRTAATQAMAIGWYTIGGLAAGLTYRELID